MFQIDGKAAFFGHGDEVPSVGCLTPAD